MAIMDVDMPRAGRPLDRPGAAHGPGPICSEVDRRGETTVFDGVRGTSSRLGRYSIPDGFPPRRARRVVAFAARPRRCVSGYRWASHRSRPDGSLRGEDDSAPMLGATNGTHAPAAAAAAAAAVLARRANSVASSLSRTTLKSAHEPGLWVINPRGLGRFEADRDD
jgi:hypothetical protein